VRQPLIVAPAGGITIRGEPILLLKLQAVKEAVRSPAKKGLQSQKARIVAQMVPAQAAGVTGTRTRVPI
jgi:hypothetical protein